VEYVIAVFSFGSVLLLIGLIGGDLKAHGFEIPKVGALPRFTTTVLGSGVLLLSLILWAVSMASENTAKTSAQGPDPTQSQSASALPRSTRPDVQPGTTAATAPHLSPTRPAAPGRATVLVHFGIVLSGPMYAAQVQLTIDGVTQSGLDVDQASQERVTELRTSAGPHRYDLLVDWIDVQGEEHLDSGSGTLSAAEGNVYGVRVDGVGSALLVSS
jgi:hypothetical protein